MATLFENDNAKRRTVVSPWRNLAEYRKVCDWLYGPDSSATTRRKALEYLNIWTLRRSSLCPASVVATAVMIDVQLKDESNILSISEEDLRKLYANAFMRFFNFMTSIMHKSSNNILSMYETARELGLPSYVVDLRHRCAHGQILPPLMMLRNAARYCTKWLYDYYWKVQQSNMSEVPDSELRHKDETVLDNEINCLVALYDTALEVHMKGANTLKLARRYVHGKRFQNLKDYYVNAKCQTLENIFNCIAQDLLTIPKRYSNSSINIKNVLESYIEAILKMNYFFNLYELEIMDVEHLSTIHLKSKYSKEVQRLLAATQSFFRMLALHNLLEDLLDALIQMAENSVIDHKRKIGASFWSLQIIEGFIAFRKCKRSYQVLLNRRRRQEKTNCSSENITTLTVSLRELLIYCGINRKTTLILSGTIHRPWIWGVERCYIEKRIQRINIYTKPVIKRLLRLVKPKLNKSNMQMLLSLINAYIPKDVLFDEQQSDDENSEMKIYSVNDVLSNLNSNDTEMRVTNKCEQATDIIDAVDTTSYGVWSVLDDDLNWSTTPLGKLPWQ